jgi:hypothetical protein
MSPTSDISHSAATRWHGLMKYKPVPLKVLTIMSGGGRRGSGVAFMLYRMRKEAATQANDDQTRGLMIHLSRHRG